MAESGIQKTNVTLKMLLNSGILSKGLSLLCNNPDVSGTLNDDASITIQVGGKEKTFEFLSGAARFIEKRSLNGWIYWSVIVDGERRNLSDFRDQYLKVIETS